VLAPGNVSSLSQSATGFLRFNVSQALDDVSQALDDRVFDVLRETLLPAKRPS
jgi:hypothetical protein